MNMSDQKLRTATFSVFVFAFSVLIYIMVENKLIYIYESQKEYIIYTLA